MNEPKLYSDARQLCIDYFTKTTPSIKNTWRVNEQGILEIWFPKDAKRLIRDALKRDKKTFVVEKCKDIFYLKTYSTKLCFGDCPFKALGYTDYHEEGK